MGTPNEEYQQYVKDPRIACKFGRKCYQKNKIHHEKYKHPPKRKELPTSSNEIKKRKRSTEGEQTSINRNVTTIKNDSLTKKKIKADENDQELPKKCQNTFIDSSCNSSQNDNGSVSPKKTAKTVVADKKLFIKDKFLVDMPDDFYKFWDFCGNLKHSDPKTALSDASLTLVGPFDVLAGKFSDVEEKESDDYLVHWRYYYDPPEFQTIIKGLDKTQYHIGYFRDAPKKLPVFLASNKASENGEFKVMGSNIFAAVNLYLEDFKKTCNPFLKTSISNLQTKVKAEAQKLDLDISERSNSITNRSKHILSTTFNKLGLVVPYQKKTQVGYRHLCVSNKELRLLLDRIDKASDLQRGNVMSELQSILTATSIATDECDFGTGIELGWDIIAHGTNWLNATIDKYLTTSYKLLEYDEFATIISTHMKNRKKGTNLSIV